MILNPNLSNFLKHHIAMSIESFDAGEEFLVASEIDQNLDIVFDSAFEYGQGTNIEVIGLVCVDDAWDRVCGGEACAIVDRG